MINEIMKRLSELPNVTMDDGQEYIQLYDAMEMVKRALEQLSGDLISRQDVLDMWRQITCYDRTCHARDEGRCTETFCDFKLFEYKINHMSSAKPQEPKTGHWEYIRCDMYECSECGSKVSTSKDPYESFKYCSKRGARMISTNTEEEPIDPFDTW